MIRWLWAALVLVVAQQPVHATRDNCTEFSAAAVALLSCPWAPSEIVPEIPPCSGVAGVVCPISCGTCDTFFGPAYCDPQVVYENKAKLAAVLHDLGVWEECRAPPVEDNQTYGTYEYVKKNATVLTQALTAGYASSDPLDPCRFPGVVCDRCGATIHLVLGMPSSPNDPTLLPGNVTSNLFELRQLQNLALQRKELPANSPDMPFDGWENLVELTHLYVSRMHGGVVPLVGDLPGLIYVRFGFNGFTSGFNNVLSARWGVQFDEAKENMNAVSGELLSDRLCNQPSLVLLSLSSIGLVGPLPACAATLLSLGYVTLPGSFIEGPIAPILQSTQLVYVYIGPENHFTGTLPETLSSASRLEELHVPYNMLFGTVPMLNSSSLVVVDLVGNRLVSAGAIVGNPEVGVSVDLSSNNISALPAPFWVLPEVTTLNLASNLISTWPLAGVHPVGTIGEGNVLPPFCDLWVEPAFSWPSMRILDLSNNPLRVEVRDFLVSLSNLELLTDLSAVACELQGLLPNEGGRLTPFIAEDCRRTADGFRSLITLNINQNSITGLDARPWGALTQAEFGSNNITRVDGAWLTGTSGPQIVYLYGNPDLRHSVTPPSEAGRCPKDDIDGVHASPVEFDDGNVGGYQCTELCPMGLLGRRRVVDATLDFNAMCKCLPGFYGSGITCTTCPADHYCPGGELNPRPCVSNTTSAEGQLSEDACTCVYPLYRQQLSATEWTCALCPANFRRDVASEDTPCEACPEGTTASGGSECTACLPGTAAAPGAGSGCRVCEAGTFSDTLGAARCTACGITRYQPARGATYCENCTAGKQAWRWLEIEQRYADLTIATSESDCGCQAGLRTDGAGCQECGEGLVCPGGIGDTMVRLLEGYSSDLPISVYRCWGQAARCPGDLPPGDSCAEGRRGIACGRCKPGTGPVPDGTCQSCTTSAEVYVPVGAVGLLVAVTLGYLWIDRHSTKKIRNHTMLSISVSISLLLQVVHHVGLVANLSLEWSPPLSYLFAVAKLMSFDLELLQIQCVSDMDPLTLYAGKLAVLSYIFFCIFFLYVVTAVLFHGCRFGKRWSSLFTCTAVFISVFYIAIVATTSGPLQCQSHPNGQLTSRSYASVVCWENEEHVHMVIVALIAVLFPVAYLGYVVVKAYQYPRMLALGDMDFMRTYSCLFSRFNADAYWYIPIHMLRSLLLALSPVITAVEGCILCMFLVIFVSVTAVCRLLPWRVESANALDVVCCGAVLLLLAFAAFFVPDTEDKRSNLAIIATIVLLTATVAVIMSIVLTLVNKCRSKAKAYAYFLCHHKAGAGAFVRLLKIVILDEGLTRQKVFVDSDNLEDLDNLFNHVQDETESLVAIWSADLLMRPWCAGEITTAHVSKVQVQQVRMPDCRQPSPSLVTAYSSEVETAAIFEQGISDELIEKAFSWFVTLPHITMPAVVTRANVDKLCHMLARREIGALPHVAASRIVTDVAELAITCDALNSEAVSTALVLEKMITHTLATTGQPMDPVMAIGTDEFVTKVARVIVVCTNGCFTSANLSQVLIVCCYNKSMPFPVVAEEGFRFLTKDGIEELKKNSGDNLEEAVDRIGYIQYMFKQIAPQFVAQHASDQALRTAAKNICRRITATEKPQEGRGLGASKTGRDSRLGGTTSIRASYSSGEVLGDEKEGNTAAVDVEIASPLAGAGEESGAAGLNEIHGRPKESFAFDMDEMDDNGTLANGAGGNEEESFSGDWLHVNV